MNKYNNTVEWKVPFIDFLVGLLALFVLLVVCFLALISPDEEKDSGLDLKAEYIITSTWADAQDCDVDMWILDPLQKYTSFNHRSNGFITLDRDDRGILIDTETGPDGKTYTFPDNKEMSTLRKIIPGEYTVNLHLYNCRPDGKPKNAGDPYILPVTLEIMKLNPKLESVFKKEIRFEKVWEEQTVVHFVIDNAGNYKYLDNNYVPMKSDTTPSSISSIPFSSPFSGAPK